MRKPSLNTCVVLKGDQVFVSVCSESAPRERRRVKLPLVPSKNPGRLELTNDIIAEYLNDQDVSGGH